jgi:hypothetical protein
MDLQGEFEVDDESVVVQALEGRLGGALVTATGRLLRSSPRGSEPTLRCTARIADLELTDRLFEACPAEIRAFLSNLRPTGAAEVPVLEIRGNPGSPDAPWEISGEMLLRGASFLSGPVVRDLDATLTIAESRIERTDFRLVATARAARANLLGHPLEDLYFEVDAGPRRVEIRSVEGRAYGGSLAPADTWVIVDASSPFSYRGELRFGGIDVERYLEAQDPDEAAIRGVVQSRIRFEGRGNDLLAVRASGRAEVDDARLFEVPIIRSILQVLPLRRPPVFTRAETKFRLDRGLFEIDELSLYSVPLSLYGDGTLDLDGTVDLLLFPVVAPDLPSIFLVSDIWRLIQNQLIAFHIQGPIDRPEARVENLVTGLIAPGEPRRGRPIPPEFPAPAEPFRF